MALIKCPECGKEISDKSEKCIHCGYPLRSRPLTQEYINGKCYDVSFLKDSNLSLVKKIHLLNDLSGCGVILAKEIAKKYHVEPVTIQNDNIPKCPTCGSTNIEKISGTKCWLSTGLFGLASSDVGKTMVCKKCGYKW